MSKTSMPSKNDVQNPVLIAEATDESLIDAARELNASYNGHLRRSIEAFWRMGETLSHLFRRRHLEGRWADILAEIGINITTDNHARRLFQATTLDGLSEYKNKTAALRYFGILSTPSSKVRAVPSPEASGDKSGEYTGSSRREQITVEPQGRADGDRLAKVERPEGRISTSKKGRVVEPVHVPAEMEVARMTLTTSRAGIVEADDSLEVLAKIAARLDYLAADVIQVTGDHLAQIDRMLRALDVIRSKGVIDAA